MDKKKDALAPVVNDVVSPKLRRDAAMYAPVTNAFSPNAAAGKLVDSRLTRSGQAMPSTIGPPTPAGLAQPPQQGVLNRIGGAILGSAPNSTAAFSAAATPQSGEGVFGMLGRGTRMVKEAAVAPFEAAGNAATAVGRAIGNTKDAVAAGYNLQQPPAPQATITTSPATNQRPVFSIGPKQIASGVNALAGALTRAPNVAGAPAAPPAPSAPQQPGANAAAPGQVGLSEKTQQPLPGAPVVGADGSVQYDQAFMDRNKTMIDKYQKQNVVQTVVPGAGVAQSMATGGNMQAGALTRPPPQGFTNADRAAQLDGFARQGRSYTEGKVRDAIGQAAARGDADAVAKLSGAANGLASPPLEPMKRAMNNADAAASNDAARLGMEQDAARQVAEQQGLQTQQEQIKLQQAQQMQDLTSRLLAGDKDAEAQMAKLTKQDPSKPMKVAVPIGADEMGKPITADGIWQDGQLVFDPRSAGQGANGMQPIPYSEALDALRANDTPERRAAFQSVYNVDPVRILGR